MTYVVTENCINCKHGTCISVCPVDAFREGENFLVIDPVDCIDCHLCVSECPEDAIYPLDAVPDDQNGFIAVNALLAKVWPEIIEPCDPHPEAERWSDTPGKRSFLIVPMALSAAVDASLSARGAVHATSVTD
jgi:ferredoxin